MKKPLLAIFLTLAATLAGCASKAPTDYDLEVANYGQYPDNYLEITSAFIAADLGLVSPLPATFYSWGKPVRGWDEGFDSIGTNNEGRWFGYVVCATVDRVYSGRFKNPSNKGSGPQLINKAFVFLLINNGEVRARSMMWRNGEVRTGTILGNPVKTCKKNFPNARLQKHKF